MLNSKRWPYELLVSIWSNKNPHSLWQSIQNSTATLEESLAVNCKIKSVLSYDLAVVILGIYSADLTNDVYMKSSMTMFITSLFLIAQNLKPPKYPVING